MSHTTLAQAEFEALNKEYGFYINKLKAAWLSKNRVNSHDVYEVMRPEDRAKVHHSVAEWSRYITPLAEAWWEKRGYGIVWPAEDSKPMRVYKLKTV